jgi:SAM-dependent methyltransferase
MDDSNAYQSAEFAEIYDAVYGDRGDAPFWNAMAATANDGPLLEIGCGTGRVLLPLARAGYEITGLDLSTHMIERCRAKLETERPEVRDRVRLLQADMTSFDLHRRFAMVISPFGGFHHLRTVEEQLSCLERCRAHLAPHGTLVLDLSNPDPVPTACLQDDPDDDEAAATLADWNGGRRIRSWITVVSYDRAQQCNECEMVCEIVAPDGSVARRVTQAFSLRYLFRYELEHLLVRGGFRLVTLYGDYDRSPFAGDSLGMIAVAESVGAGLDLPATGTISPTRRG